MDASLAEQAYVILRRELVTCRLAPGSRINISSLQAQFSLNQAAVREALSRLSAEGLVEAERNRGFLVAPVSLEGYRYLMQATVIVELPCVRASIENGDVEWELNLVSTYHRALRTLELVAAGKEDVEYWTSTEARSAGGKNLGKEAFAPVFAAVASPPESADLEQIAL